MTSLTLQGLRNRQLPQMSELEVDVLEGESGAIGADARRHKSALPRGQDPAFCPLGTTSAAGY